MQDQDKPAADAVGPVVGGAAALSGAAAVLAYANDSLSDGSDAAGLTAANTGQTATSAQPLLVSEFEASRFLAQATNGATRSDIDLVQRMGVATWLQSQFYTSRGRSHWKYLELLGYPRRPPYDQPSRGPRLWDLSIWRQLIGATDQLRQRVALALLDLMVVNVNALPLRYSHYAMAAYMDLLLDHAFGNFRALLTGITTNSAMAQFLTLLGSSKENSSGRMPDENYARELLQLFTIGLYELDMNGTVRLDASGNPIETFTQDDVAQFARVFTGLKLQNPSLSTPDTHAKPLVMDADKNETGSSSFLGKTVSGGGMQALEQALDVVFWHRNVPPFIAKSLIQRLVMSNPSPAYVSRVAKKFANNGVNVRGDMRAVITAIFTDPEARSNNAIGAPHTGRLREPSQRITGWARAFHATSTTGEFPLGDLSGRLGQSPGHSPSVFNFYRPGYSPPNSELNRRGLVAPELQITDDQTVVAYLNYIYPLIRQSRRSSTYITANYSPLMPLANKPAVLFDEINLLLAAGQISEPTRSYVIDAISTIPATTTGGRFERVCSAIIMTMASPQYLVLQ